MATAEKPPLTDDEKLKILDPDNPEVQQEKFIFGANGDGTPRTWVLRPLDWKFEQMFRKHAMPLLAESFKPFEALVGVMSQTFVTEHTPSVVDALCKAELAADMYLTSAMHIILLSQDKNITIKWVEENAKSRDQMFDLVEKQADLHKLMDRLGERLAGRLGRLASMMGLQIDLPTLKQLWMQLTGDFSAKISRFVSTAHNASGQFTENSSEILTRTSSVRVNGQDKTDQENPEFQTIPQAKTGESD